MLRLLYSPECVEGVFSEVRLTSILNSANFALTESYEVRITPASSVTSLIIPLVRIMNAPDSLGPQDRGWSVQESKN